MRNVTVPSPTMSAKPRPRRGRILASLAGLAVAVALLGGGLAARPTAAQADVSPPNQVPCDYADPLPGCDTMTYSPPQYTVTGRDADPDAAQAEAQQLAREVCNGPYHTVRARPGVTPGGVATFALTFTCA